MRFGAWRLMAAALTCAAATTVVFAGAARPLTMAEVREASVCLPSVGDPPDTLVRFSNGRYASAAIPFAEMRAFAAGRLNGEDTAAVEIVWNTGGSGNWEVVALCRRVDGQPRCANCVLAG